MHALFLSFVLAVPFFPQALSGPGDTAAELCERGEGPGGRRGPPPEAFEACADQEVDTACAIDTPDGIVEGICRVPRGDRLVCVPNHHGQ